MITDTGVVVDIGLGMTRVCPVVGGKVVKEGIQAQFEEEQQASL